MSTLVEHQLDHEELRARAREGAPGKLGTAIASAAGTCVENYDFIAYGTAAALFFGDAFFPENDPTVATLLSFATLAVGFLMRPIGGALGGHLGDRYGRKPVLVGALLLMGISTMVIGILPTYASVGLIAPILLVTVRMIQGLAFGAEWGGAVMMAYEHAPWRRRGFFASLPQAGNPLGIALANLTFLASVTLPGDLKWRVPFLASAILVIVGLVARMKLNESPEFEDSKAKGEIVKNPILSVVRDDWRNILRIIALRIVESGAYYITATYVLNYITSNDLAPRSVALTGLVIASFVAIFVTVGAGALTDRLGRRPVYLAACVAVICFGFPLFLLAHTGKPILIIAAYVIGIGLIHATLTGTQASWFAELFPTNTRTSGASLGYQLAASIAGFTPFIAALLATRYGWHGPASFYVLAGVMGVAGVLATQETWGARRRREVEAFIDGGDVPAEVRPVVSDR